MSASASTAIAAAGTFTASSDAGDASDDDETVDSLLARLQAAAVEAADAEEMSRYSRIYAEIEEKHPGNTKERIAVLFAKHLTANPVEDSECEKTASLLKLHDDLLDARDNMKRILEMATAAL